MSHRVFLTLHRIALRCAPRGMRDRHADEQRDLIQAMLRDERPTGALRSAAWKSSLLARTAWAGLAARSDRWPRPVLPVALLVGLGSDVRLALRSLWRSPWYSGSTVIVLAAGLALSAVVLSIVDGVLFKPLPFPRAHELFVVDARVSSQPSAHMTPVSPVEMDIWASAVSDLALTAVSASLSPFDRRDGVSVWMRTVDEQFFDVIGIHPDFGSFLPEDFGWSDRSQGTGERYWPVVISHALWRQDFGLDPTVVGRRITQSERGGEKFGIVVRGVMPEDFVFPLDLGGGQTDVISPDGSSLALRQGDIRRTLFVLARTSLGAPVSAVATRLREAMRRESPLRPSTDGASHGAVIQPPFDSLALVPISAHLGASARPALRLIAAGAALLLLIICLNITGLTTARSVDRAADFATRRALGASTWRLARLVTIEVFALAAVSVGLGLLAASPLLHVTLSLLPSSLVLLKVPAIDLRVIAAMAATTFACAGVIAVLPAARASARAETMPAAHRTGRRVGAVRKGGLVLIGAQTAMGFVLVTAGALSITSLALAWTNDAGFAADRTVLFEAYVTTYSDNRDSVDKLSRARAGLAQVPGVTGMAATNIHMFTEMFTPGWAPVGSPPVQGTTDHLVEQTFFSVMGLRVLEGRLPEGAEWTPDGPFAVISETAARLWWPGETAVGRQIASQRQRGSPARTILAVVRDARYESLDRDPLGSVYLPIDFASRYGAVFVIATDRDPAKVIPGLLSVARDTRLKIEQAVPLDTALFVSTIDRALPAWLFGSLGAVGLIVLAVGTFGLLAMAATQRARELVIRVALGASSSHVIGLLVREQLTAVCLGLVAGAAASYWTVSLLQAQLYRVSAFSPSVWLWSAAVLLAVATLATLIPSVRQSRLDPAQALRLE